MTENLDDLSDFGAGDNIGIPFFPAAAEPGPESLEQRALLSPSPDRHDGKNCLEKDLETDHLVSGNCASDETRSKKQEQQSDGNSVKPSPTKSGTTPGFIIDLSNGTLLSQYPVVHTSLQASTELKENSEPQTVETKGVEIDITDFIDNFLGDEELMRNVPAIPHGLSFERSSVPSASRQDFIPLNSTNSATNDDNTIATSKPFLVQHTFSPAQPAQKPETSIKQKRDAVPAQSCPEISRHEVHKHVKRTSWTAGQVGASLTQVPIRRSEKRKPRTYSQAVPSQHCHICSRRPTEGSPHQVCGNLQKGRCRKTICTKCFHQFRWDLKAAREAPPGSWECPHCRGQCPQRAQCVIYNRTSDRRRLKLINHRKRKNEGSKALNGKNAKPKKKQATEKSNSPNSGKTTTPSLASLDFNKTAVMNTGAGKARPLSVNSKKSTASKSKKKPSKCQEARQSARTIESEYKTSHVIEDITEGNLGGFIFGVQKPRPFQQPQDHGILEHSEMKERGPNVNRNIDSKDMQEQMQHILFPGNDLHLQKASCFMTVPDMSSSNAYATSPQGTSGQIDGGRASLEGSSPHEAGESMVSPDSFLSIELNTPLIESDVPLGQELNQLRNSEVGAQVDCGILCGDEFWPRTISTSQTGIDGGGYEDAPEDLWMLPEGPSDSMSDLQGDSGMDLIVQDGSHGAGGFPFAGTMYSGGVGVEEQGALRV